MTCRPVCALLALAGALMTSGCKQEQAKPATTDSGPTTKADTAKPLTDTRPAVNEDTADPGAGPDTVDAVVVTCLSGDDDLIADFNSEDRNGLHPADGRQGGFYVYGDGSIKGAFEPPLVKGEDYPVDPDNGNDQCSGPGSFHTKASSWGVWGAALGTDFKPKGDNGLKGSYDASKYKGVSFWAKATAALNHVQVSFKDIYSDGDASFDGTDSADAGFSQCVYVNQSRPENCSPFLVKFGEDPTYFPAYQDYKIDDTWKRFDVYFADTRQDQYNKGFHAAEDPINQSNLDVAHLTGLSVQVNADFSTTPPTPQDFEIWVDDFYFIR
jgi:hypothetical protein